MYIDRRGLLNVCQRIAAGEQVDNRVVIENAGLVAAQLLDRNRCNAALQRLAAATVHLCSAKLCIENEQNEPPADDWRWRALAESQTEFDTAWREFDGA